MIQFNRSYFENIDKDKIQEILKLAQPYWDFRANLKQRYARKSSPTEIVQGENGRGVIMFEYYITNFAQGYLSGKPATYTVRKREDIPEEKTAEFQNAINKITRYNDDPATFTELIHDYLVTTAAYSYIYENKYNQIVYTRLDSLNTIVIYDYGTPPYPIAVLREWIETDEENEEVTRIEIITEKSKRIFDSEGGVVPFEDYDENGNKTTMTEKPLFWGDVPVVAFESPDSLAIFEPALWLIETYENLLTNIRNMTQYNDDAKLKVTGYAPANQSTLDIEQEDGTFVTAPNPARQIEEDALLKAACLFVQAGGDVSWLLKNISYDGILSILKQLHDNITMLTGVPNMTDEAFANANNASALGYKLYPLDQYSATADRIFRKGYLRLWEIVTNRLNSRGADYDFRDIDIAFTRNIPTDRDKKTQTAITGHTSGLLSLETAIKESGFDVDAKSEIARIEAEKSAEYDDIRAKLRNMSENTESGEGEE